MSSLYEVLGVLPNAPHAEIKAAYRKIMAECHPDHEGSDPERAKAAGEAYATLGDTQRRARYDETGKFNVEENVAVQARGLIRSIFGHMLHDHIVKECAPFGYFTTGQDPNFHLKIVAELNTKVGEFNSHEKTNNKAIKTLNRLLNSVSTKDGEEDEIFNPIIKGKIETAEGLNKEIEAKRAPYLSALELMKNGFQFNSPDPYPNPHGQILIGS